MTSYVAFLRGINVGGNKTIPMTKLKSLLESLGGAPTKTHLNSGNVIFASKRRDRAKLGKQLGDAIEAEFGFRPTIVLRSAAELKHIIAKNPFSVMASEDPGHLLLMVLEGDSAIARWRDLMGATDPAKAAAGTLRKEFASSIEANAVHGSDSPESAATEIPYFFSSLELCPR